MSLEQDKNALLQEVLSELTADGTSEVSWQQIEDALGLKLQSHGGVSNDAKEYIEEVYIRETEN